jgi:hypothetical protein
VLHPILNTNWKHTSEFASLGECLAEHVVVCVAKGVFLELLCFIPVVICPHHVTHIRHRVEAENLVNVHQLRTPVNIKHDGSVWCVHLPELGW